MRLGKYVACACIVTALAVVLFVGCGVNSGVRDENTPGYSGPGAGLPGGANNPGSNPGDASAEEQKVFELVNEEREKAGLGAVQWCDGIAACARAHSNDMCDRNYFSHTNPEGEGPSDRGRAGHAGSYTFDPIVPSPYQYLAENIAMGQSSAEQAMHDWMNSSGHRNNILTGSHTHVGIGRCEGCGRHWTQIFSRRSGSTPPGGGGGGKSG